MRASCLLLLLAGCSTKGPDLGPSSSADTGAGDWESDADTDADSDTDTDADSDADTDADTDADMDGDTDTEGPDDTGDTGDTDTAAECDDATDVTLYLSPDDSNSMSSPAQVRDAVLGGWNQLERVPIRTWEFLNYYGFDYPAPADGLSVTPLLQRLDDDSFVLQIGVASPERTNDDRAPMNIVLVLDTSGSMRGTPIQLLRESAYAIATSLKEGDVVSLVEWDVSNAVRLEAHVVDGPYDARLLSAIATLEEGGGTDLHGGLTAGYAIADRTYDPTRINRVVLISDGGANAGVTSTSLISRYAGAEDSDGIYLVGVGVGTASTYDDELMDTVTDVGRGASVFVGNVDEAWAQLGPEGFVRTMDVAYRDVGVRLALPPGFRIERFSGEEYSTDHRDIEPQHIAPGDAMVFYQTLSTCAPELAGDDAVLTVSATYRDPITFEQHTTEVSASFAELLEGDTRLLDKGAAVYTYAEALKACQRARMSEWPALLGPARAAVERAQASNPGDDDLTEILAVIAGLGG